MAYLANCNDSARGSTALSSRSSTLSINPAYKRVRPRRPSQNTIHHHRLVVLAWHFCGETDLQALHSEVITLH
jgi:hypothetical protein